MPDARTKGRISHLGLGVHALEVKAPEAVSVLATLAQQ